MPLLKKLFFIFPGIHQATEKSEKHKGDSMGVEMTPALFNVFKKNWEINYKNAERLKQLPVKYVSFHAPYIDDGKVYQKNRNSLMDSVFDLTDTSANSTYCLVSHLQLIDYLSPKGLGPTLVVHPLPASPQKSEREIIDGIVGNIRKVIPLLEDLNIYIGIENMPWLKGKHERYTQMLGGIDFFKKLISEINHPHVGITFDWGHANSYARYMTLYTENGGTYPFNQEGLLDFSYHKLFLTELKDKIYHMHLNYNNAHILEARPPFHSKNFDYHADLTRIPENELPLYAKSLAPVLHSEALRSMVIESIPSFLNFKERISRYESSIDILRTMLK